MVKRCPYLEGCRQTGSESVDKRCSNCNYVVRECYSNMREFELKVGKVFPRAKLEDEFLLLSVNAN